MFITQKENFVQTMDGAESYQEKEIEGINLSI